MTKKIEYIERDRYLYPKLTLLSQKEMWIWQGWEKKITIFKTISVNHLYKYIDE